MRLEDHFKKIGVELYHNENLDLDHYYQEPYQDADDNDSDLYEMSTPFESDQSKSKRTLDYSRSGESNFAFFMDGSRRTYKIGDIILDKTRIFPVVVAQVCAGSTYRGEDKKIKKHLMQNKNLMLLSSRLPNADFADLKIRICKSEQAKNLKLDIIQYRYEKGRDIVPVNAAIAKANSEMHGLEINILQQMVNSGVLDNDHMLIVDGPLQFIKEDDRSDEFADLFYSVVGVSRTFDTMLPMSEHSKGGKQIGTRLLQLEYGERTPVFRRVNSKSRVYGSWYLRIRPRNRVKSPLEGIIKVEKMATREDLDNGGFDTDVIDNLSRSLLEEGIPTCHGNDERWAAHLYPVYLTETMVKSSFFGDYSFMSQFRRNF